MPTPAKPVAKAQISIIKLGYAVISLLFPDEQEVGHMTRLGPQRYLVQGADGQSLGFATRYEYGARRLVQRCLPGHLVDVKIKR